MMKILLDAGHGINTPGKRSPLWPDGSQLLEFEFNRDIVRRVASELSRMHLHYEIITPEINDIPLLERGVALIHTLE